MSDGGDTPIAAVAEVEDEGRRGEFRGVTLQLPAKLPGTVAFDLGAMQNAQVKGDTMKMLGSMFRFIESVLGDEGLEAVRQKLADDGDSMDEVSSFVTDLVGAITSPYAVTPGESTPSETPSGATGG